MRIRFRLKWRPTRKLLIIIGLILAIAVVLELIFLEIILYGTGFAGKTLWDWFQLLIIPAVLAVGGYAFNYTTSRNDREATERRTQTDREAAEKRAQTEREIALDNQCEAALQAYIDKISELLLHEGLRNSVSGDEVRKVATLQTLTVLPRLDGRRKGSVLLFLSEAGLIDKSMSIVQLGAAGIHGADLRGCDLSGMGGASLYNCFISYANLQGANFTGMHLRGIVFEGGSLYEARFINADLRDSEIYYTNLSGADFTGADLTDATIVAVNLTGAKVTQEQLDKAKSLQGTTMPDGSKHP